MSHKLNKFWLAGRFEANRIVNDNLLEKKGLPFLYLNAVCILSISVFIRSKNAEFGFTPLLWFMSLVLIYALSLFIVSIFNKPFRHRLRPFILYALPAAAAGLYLNMFLLKPALPEMLATVVTLVFVSSVIRTQREAVFFAAFYSFSTLVCAVKEPTPDFVNYYVPTMFAMLFFQGVALFFRFNDEATRRENSEILANTLAVWNNIVENANVVMALSDVHGVVVDISKTIGFEKSQVVGTNFIDFIPEEQRYIFTAALKRASIDKIATNFEISMPMPAGNIMTFATSVWQLLEKDQIVGFMYFTLDVTAQKIADQRQQHTAQVSILGELSASIAHEIRNPLTVITGNLDLIIGQAIKGASAMELMPRFTKMKVMTERIGAIVKNVRRMYHPGDSEPVLNEYVAELISEAVSFCSQKCKEKNIKIDIIQVIPGLKVLCKPVLISQAILNLLHNSIDAALEYNEKWIKIVVQELGDEVKISVIDSGKGLPKHVLANIGRTFFTTKEVGHGNGLGISLAKRVIEDHGGEFSYDTSSPNTKFDLIIPKKMRPKVAA